MHNNQRKEQKSQKDMQNWKKQILMDPVLNSLFDENVNADDFFTKKIMPLEIQEIASTFSKLSTVNTQLMNNMQKQVQAKSHFIQKAYIQFLQYRQELGDDIENEQNINKPTECLNYLKNFNKKYQKLQQSLILWKNITSMLHFSKALQTFRVNANILRTLMRGYNKDNEETINPIRIAKIIKQLTELSVRFDFSGISSFENQRSFISGVKNIVSEIGKKKLIKLLQECQKLQKLKAVQQLIESLHSLGTLKDIVIQFLRGIFPQMSQKIKKVLQLNTATNISNFNQNLDTILIPYLIQTSKQLIFLQQKLVKFRKVQFSNVPNFFIRFWQKLCEYLKDTIQWSRKDQQNRNIPKNREKNIIWKYPIIFNRLATVCSTVQSYILQNAIYNNYNFAKNKQKLIVQTLLELSLRYHQQINKYFNQIGNVLNSQSEQKDKWIKNLSIIFGEIKGIQIWNLILNKLCHKLKEHANNQQALKKLKQQIKTLIILNGKNFGISKKQLEIFKIKN